MTLGETALFSRGRSTQVSESWGLLVSALAEAGSKSCIPLGVWVANPTQQILPCGQSPQSIPWAIFIHFLVLVLEATPPGFQWAFFLPDVNLKKKGNLTSNFPVRTASLRATIDIHHHPPLLSILGSYHPSMISLLVLVALLAAVTQIFIPKGSKPLVWGTYSGQGEATACCSRQLLLCPLKKAFLLWVPGPVKSQSPKLWGQKI